MSTTAATAARPQVRPVAAGDAAAWITMRRALWPDESAPGEHAAEVARFLAGAANEPQAVLVADLGRDGLAGFVELSIRPCAEGCASDRVAYLEGWYVAPAHRRRGLGRALVAAAEDWARARGCREFASDTWPDNAASIAAHRALGFRDAGLVQCFAKELTPCPRDDSSNSAT